jgi:hypothetical protein
MSLFESSDGNINQKGADILSIVEHPIYNLYKEFYNKGCCTHEINTILMQESFNLVMLFIFGGKENAKQTEEVERTDSISANPKEIKLFNNGLMTQTGLSLSNKLSQIIAKTIKDNYLANESIQEIAYIILYAVNSARIHVSANI